MSATSGASSNHALWAGPAVSLFGLVSYFTVFYRWPALRDFPWLNLLLLAAGIGLSIAGLRRAWPRGGWRAVAGAVGAVVSGALTALFLWYVFSLSFGLPDRSLALDVGERIPAGTLLDHTGAPVPLAASADERVILVFYRGHW